MRKALTRRRHCAATLSHKWERGFSPSTIQSLKPSSGIVRCPFVILRAAKDPSERLDPAGILRCAQDDKTARVLDTSILLDVKPLSHLWEREASLSEPGEGLLRED